MDQKRQQAVGDRRRSSDVGKPVLPVNRVPGNAERQQQDDVVEKTGAQGQQPEPEEGGPQFLTPFLARQERGGQKGQGETAQRPSGERVQNQPARKGPNGPLHRPAQKSPSDHQQKHQVRMGPEERNPGQRGALNQRGQRQQGQNDVQA